MISGRRLPLMVNREGQEPRMELDCDPSQVGDGIIRDKLETCMMPTACQSPNSFPRSRSLLCNKMWPTARSHHTAHGSLWHNRLSHP